jgi:hypothetical protein
MITLGIDLAAQPRDTAACVVAWGERVVIDVPSTNADDPGSFWLAQTSDPMRLGGSHSGGSE